MKKYYHLTILTLLLFPFISVSQTTTYIWDDVQGFSQGQNGTYRDLVTDSWKFTRVATFTGDNFFKINDNSTNIEGSNVWSNTVSLNSSTPQTFFKYGDPNGGAGSFPITDGKVYSLIWKDVPLTSNSEGFVFETSSLPSEIINISTSSSLDNVSNSEDLVVTGSLDINSPIEQEFFLRYTVDGFINSTLISMTISGTTITGTIPKQSLGSNVEFYVFSSVLTETDLNSTDIDLATLTINNNSGSNYSYNVNYIGSVLDGFWSTATTWEGEVVPTGNDNIKILNIITLDIDASAKQLLIDGTLNASDLSTRTLTISDGGSITNNGNFIASDGTVSFEGGGTVDGTVSFNNVSIAGGLNFGTSSTITNNLTVLAGGFAINSAPIYSSGSTLIFETGGSYTIDGANDLWKPGSSIGSGVPSNVQITTTNPLNIFGAREVPGNLTINSEGSVVQGNNAFIIQGNLDNSGSYSFVNDGANTLTIEGDLNNRSGGTFSLSNTLGGDLRIRGNWDNADTFEANNRAVFFDGNSPQTIENAQAAGIEIPFLYIQNNVTALSDLTVSDLLEFNVDNTLTLNGTLIYGQINSRLRIVGNTNFETNDAIFPATNGPVNFEINHSGTVTLHDSRMLDGDIDVSSGTLIIKEGTGLTAGNLNNSGIVTLESTSTAYSSLIVNATSGTGIINYNRFTNVIGTSAGGGNDLITPPLSGQRFDAFALANEGALAASGTLRAFAPFDNTANPGVYTNFDIVNDAETTLAAGIGYRAAAGDVLQFTGTANTADIGVPINSATGTFGEWNLIGNPYPSYLDIAVFLNHEVSSGTKNIDLLDNASGIYGYNGNATNRWEIITLANSSGELMAPGQGFFVASGSASATLQFTRGMRTTGSSDDFIQGRNASLIYLKLKAATSDKSYTTDFYFNDNSTLGLDPGYDAKTWGGDSSGFKLYSHLVEDNSGLPIGLQSLHSTDLTNTTIPLGVNTNAGEQLTFSIAESSLPTTVNIYLEDTATNTFALLNTGDYTITPNNALNGVGRFYLRFGDTALSTTDSNLENLAIYTNKTNQTVVIAGQLLEHTTANVYDLQGRLVLSHALDDKLQVNEVDVNSLGQGVYIVELRGNTQNKTIKIILN